MSGTAHLFVSWIVASSLVFVVFLVRRGQIRVKYALLWLSVGAGMVVLSVSPGVLDALSRQVGVAYPPTTLFLVAIVFLLLLSVHVSFELSRLEEQSRTLAEQLALLRAELELPRGMGREWKSRSD